MLHNGPCLVVAVAVAVAVVVVVAVVVACCCCCCCCLLLLLLVVVVVSNMCSRPINARYCQQRVAAACGQRWSSMDYTA
eukprot:620157-Amphidinium_carterae.1